MKTGSPSFFNSSAIIATIAVVLGASANCNSASPSPEASQNTAALLQAGSVSSSGDAAAAGFQHSLHLSRFAPGASAAQKDEFGMHKIVGDQGVFATRASGMVTAISNATADVRRRTPISDNPSHNTAVQQYFLAAGLPSDQIASVQDFEVVSAPASSPKNAAATRTVQFRYSMIKRQIQGIPVPDSFAWARMNDDGSVVEEKVYWPSIPQSVVLKAVAFSSHLADKANLTAFESALPAHKDTRGLAIHHSPGEWDGPFTADAYYDVIEDRASLPRVLHADPSGAVVTLRHEQKGAWGAEVGTVRRHL